MSKQVKWLIQPPAVCEITNRTITDTFYDAKIPGGGWACMHPDTFAEIGCSTGLGKGQKYELQTDGDWLQTEGGANGSAPLAVLSDEDKRAIRDEAEARR